MQNEKIVVLQIRLSRKNCLFALALAFLCFHPRPLGSETLTMTTYYPAPYGGYVALLTTGGTAGNPANTLLARDAGMVGIGLGMTKPGVKLDVASGPGYNDRIVGRFTSLGSDARLALRSKTGTWSITSGGMMGAGGFSVIHEESGVPLLAIQPFTNAGMEKSGYVGIGTVSPSAKLEVNGDIKVRLNTWGATTQKSTGSCPQGTFVTGITPTYTRGNITSITFNCSEL